MGTNPLQVRRDRGLGPRRNPRRALAPEVSANQQSASGTGVFTPCGAVPTLGIYGYVPRLLEVYRYGWVPDTGMGTYPPQLRQNRGVGPRGNPCRTLAPEAQAYQQSASGTGVPTHYGAVSTRQYFLNGPWLLELSR